MVRESSAPMGKRRPCAGTIQVPPGALASLARLARIKGNAPSARRDRYPILVSNVRDRAVIYPKCMDTAPVTVHNTALDRRIPWT